MCIISAAWGNPISISEHASTESRDLKPRGVFQMFNLELLPCK